CHWCHVIDRESYEDPQLAKIINERFVAVKVDRDERPDVDARYQQAVGSLTGAGGWPLTAFLTPEGKVFYGGTYFPPRDAYNRPSFERVLLAVAKHYQENRGEAMRDAESLHQALAEPRTSVMEAAVVNDAFLKEGLDALRGEADPVNGGFGGAPKFPHAGALEFLLATVHRTGATGLRDIALRTLTAMAQGGVYDQVGGGFHRYSTDGQWIVPHFEKMLYDNAGLLANYVHAWQLTRAPLFRETAEGILSWIDEVLCDRSHGGYFTSQDADVGLDDDGDYFTWTLGELEKAVPPEEARVLALRYDIGEKGEMHHDAARNVLFVAATPEEIAKQLSLPVNRVDALLASGKDRLKAARGRGEAPAVDRTIYASWNGMMASAALEAAMAFGREDVQGFALKTLDRLWKQLWTPDQGMWHALAESKRKVHGLLEDHIFIVDAFLAAQTATGDPAWLKKAEEVMAFALKHFWDPQHPGFADLAEEAREAGTVSLREIRRRPLEDSPYAGANAVAAVCLQRLHALTGNDDYRLHHDEILVSFAGEAARYGPVFCGTYFLAAELWLHPRAEVVLLGSRENPRLRQLETTARSTFAPGKTILVADKEETYMPDSVAHMRRTAEAMAGPVAFVCQGTTCSPPTDDVERLSQLLRGAR
ncbi:MAG TPA: thioredoxin domain-containing protein, partial [Thermoplasmata archaeon]|nr:thioredoxin domain-containing protein [Thermoplasmata archaeon]